MPDRSNLPIPRLSVWLTHVGMVAEQVLRAFWPAFSIALVLLAALMLGLQDVVSVEIVWVVGALSLGLFLTAAVLGLRVLKLPSRAEVLMRLDETLPGRPIQALMDDQAIGAADQDSVALWQAHKARMAQRVAAAEAVKPDLRLASRDPYALRYAALLAFVVALVFGSLWRVGSVADMAPGTAAAGQGPTWEGWVEPPRYTGLPTLYLADQTDAELPFPRAAALPCGFMVRLAHIV